MIPEQVWTEYICLYCAEQVRRPDMFGCEEVQLDDGTQLGTIIRCEDGQDRLNQTFRHTAIQTDHTAGHPGTRCQHVYSAQRWVLVLGMVR